MKKQSSKESKTEARSRELIDTLTRNEWNITSFDTSTRHIQTCLKVLQDLTLTLTPTLTHDPNPNPNPNSNPNP